MTLQRRSMPAVSLLWLACTVLWACSNSSQNNTLCAPTNSNVSAPSRLLELDSNIQNVKGSGSGYLDIEAIDESGRAVQRRCSVMLAPDEKDASIIKVWTAVHCLFDADSLEFENSKYTLHVFYKNGYLPLPIQFEELAKLGKAARAVAPVLSSFPEKERNRWRFALSDDSVLPCQEQTKAFAAQLGSAKKNIACFSKNELRLLRGKVQATAETEKKLNVVLDAVRQRREKTQSALPELEKRYLSAVESFRPLSAKFPLYMRTYGYWMNDVHCSTPDVDLPSDADGRKETKNFCEQRDLYKMAIKQTVPEYYSDFAKVADAKPANLVELKALHGSVFGCQLESLDAFTAGVPDVSTICDRERLTRMVWAKLIKSGIASFTDNSFAKPGVFGLTRESYFTILFNSSQREGGALAAANTRQGNILEVAPSLGTLSPTEFNNQVILLNFDNQNGRLRLSKSDSGSMLSVFGTVPIASLSTLDQEPTSGGTSILPLPTHSEDEEPVATTSRCK